MVAFQIFVLFFAGLAFFAVAVHQWSLQRQVPHWPVAEGTVEYSEVDDSSDGWEPCVRYRYRVRGEILVGDALFPGGFVISAERRWAEDLTRRFPVGSRVWVRYDPTDPRRSTLALTLPLWAHLITLAASIGCTAVAVWIAAAD